MGDPRQYFDVEDGLLRLADAEPLILPHHILVLEDHEHEDHDLALAVDHDLAPAVDHDLAPVVDHVLAPAVDHDLVPAIDHDLAPAVDHDLAPAVDHDLAPAVDHDLAPAVDHDLAPTVDHDLAPAVDHDLAPAVDHDLAPAVDHDLAPAVDHDLAPAVDHDLAPAVTATTTGLSNEHVEDQQLDDLASAFSAFQEDLFEEFGRGGDGEGLSVPEDDNVYNMDWEEDSDNIGDVDHMDSDSSESEELDSAQSQAEPQVMHPGLDEDSHESREVPQLDASLTQVQGEEVESYRGFFVEELPGLQDASGLQVNVGKAVMASGVDDDQPSAATSPHVFPPIEERFTRELTQWSTAQSDHSSAGANEVSRTAAPSPLPSSQLVPSVCDNLVIGLRICQSCLEPNLPPVADHVAGVSTVKEAAAAADHEDHIPEEELVNV